MRVRKIDKQPQWLREMSEKQQHERSVEITKETGYKKPKEDKRRKNPNQFIGKLKYNDTKISRWESSKVDFMVGQALLMALGGCSKIRIMLLKPNGEAVYSHEKMIETYSSLVAQIPVYDGIIKIAGLRMLAPNDVEEKGELDLNIIALDDIKVHRQFVIPIGKITKVTDNNIFITIDECIKDIAYNEKNIRYLTESRYQEYELRFRKELNAYYKDKVDYSTNMIANYVGIFEYIIRDGKVLNNKYEVTDARKVFFRPFGKMNKETSNVVANSMSTGIDEKNGIIESKYEIMKLIIFGGTISSLVVTIKNDYKRTGNTEVTDINVVSVDTDSNEQYKIFEPIMFDALLRAIRHQRKIETGEVKFKDKSDELNYIMLHIPTAIKHNEKLVSSRIAKENKKNKQETSEIKEK